MGFHLISQSPVAQLFPVEIDEFAVGLVMGDLFGGGQLVDVAL